MKIFNFFIIGIFFTAISCTLDKTDYEAEISTVVTEHYDFKEVVVINSGNYTISIETLNGTFYKGYNEIRLKIINTQTNEKVSSSKVTFLPVMTHSDGSKTSGPHKYNLEYKPTSQYYSGYSVFTNESNTMSSWKLYISFTANNQTYKVNKDISVQVQSNKNLNMTAFKGNDGEQYFIALVSPQRPKVAENQLVAGIYKYNQPTGPAGAFPDPSQFSYAEVSGYTLLLDPRMPEPSMGNHSSPNNQDLIQKSDGLYHGVVNYTMTGGWTLNFIMQNQNGKIVKGTKVSTDFTPGVEGTKSELYIDILF
ncbi:hypothetical protein IQ37_00070 [Chryseobacterium piperi]|uniref:YtkA-like domain-containing protein n=1 Tax=Chryseobacterium piperi TaxID=558152 RepID=A0A086BMQ7_9FLAO|nr:hypothetical protein [Chryseobacterium piperi]ASW75012.1 hypothetical protein CJF12_12470 [Chryseobacterium piperi]KFF30221.1 hypothetical protein IQ37_00070 [Chryseobacterium piperi]